MNPRSVQALTKQKDTIEDKINRARLIKHERETKIPRTPKFVKILKIRRTESGKTNIEAEIVEAQKNSMKNHQDMLISKIVSKKA